MNARQSAAETESVSEEGAPSARSADRILRAAAELAKTHGVAGATIAAVCRRSGLPVSSVYWHFEDKDGLFSEVIRHSFAEWLVTVPRWEAEDGTTLGQGVRNVVGASYRTLGMIPDFMRVGMQVLLEKGDTYGKTRRAFLDCRLQVRRMISAWVRRVEPSASADRADDVATLVVAFADGAAVGSQIYPDWDSEEYVDLMSGMLTCLPPDDTAAY
ncbi:TetR/AcrR family transcriptional regulator [Streptomyces carpinensis]|uniref:TetR/AcrR family transcriptional regulator n=1 Tax=Streptomyces carpinensis TaxID=66369 RepID=UPI000A388F8B|nr:TetR/AcrR family transcriptional regulator [Streptomyces carpinensis]